LSDTLVDLNAFGLAGFLPPLQQHSLQQQQPSRQVKQPKTEAAQVAGITQKTEMNASQRVARKM